MEPTPLLDKELPSRRENRESEKSQSCTVAITVAARHEVEIARRIKSTSNVCARFREVLFSCSAFSQVVLSVVLFVVLAVTLMVRSWSPAGAPVAPATALSSEVRTN